MDAGYVSAAALALAAFAYIVFRLIVRREYQRRGRLSNFASFLELLVWGLYMGFPYLYNPPEWVQFWSSEVPVGTAVRAVGVGCVAAGFASAFGTMFWFGLRRAFGLQVDGLIQNGPYGVTRNPQIMGGSLLVVGTALLWPSWYAAVWAALYAVVAHWMVVTEEEHLLVVFGEEYVRYSERVPRYLGLRRSRQVG